MVISLLLIARSMYLCGRGRKSIALDPHTAQPKYQRSMFAQRREMGFGPSLTPEDSISIAGDPPAPSPRHPTQEIDNWRQHVEQDEAPLMNFDDDTHTEIHDPYARPSSPSTVAHWSTVTGMTTLTMPSQAPPAYSSHV